MAILEQPPPDWKRPPIPLRVKRLVLLQQARLQTLPMRGGERPDTLAVQIARLLGMLQIDEPQYDHRPPLSERKFDTEAWDTIPPANDPAHIEAISAEEHDRRTNGRGGEKRITTLGSDTHARAKTRRLTKQPDERLPFDPPPREFASRPRPKQKIRSRGFDKRMTRHFDGTVTPRKERRTR